jgi:hypothetical protein
MDSRASVEQPHPQFESEGAAQEIISLFVHGPCVYPSGTLWRVSPSQCLTRDDGIEISSATVSREDGKVWEPRQKVSLDCSPWRVAVVAVAIPGRSGSAKQIGKWADGDLAAQI